MLEKEKKHIGFYVSGHPLEKFKEALEDVDVALADIDGSLNGKSITVAGQIQNIKKLQKRTNKATMCKFILEDMTGHTEVICFTKTYEKYSSKIIEGGIIKIKARVAEDNTGNAEAFQLNAQEIQELAIS